MGVEVVSWGCVRSILRQIPLAHVQRRHRDIGRRLLQETTFQNVRNDYDHNRKCQCFDYDRHQCLVTRLAAGLRTRKSQLGRRPGQPGHRIGADPAAAVPRKELRTHFLLRSVEHLRQRRHARRFCRTRQTASLENREDATHLPCVRPCTNSYRAEFNSLKSCD